MRPLAHILFSVFALTTAMPSLADDEAAPQSAASVPDTLNAAYQREYAFLIAEKKTLTQQLNTLQSRSEQRIQQAAAAVMDAENALFATQKRLENLDSELQALDRTLAKNDEDLAVFEAAWTQARERIGYDADSKIPSPTQLDQLFTQTLDHLENATQMRRSIEPVFMPDGTQVSGQVIRLGEIASLATSETGSGALIPIGGGKLQVLDNLGADTANALQQGERPSTVDLYLYEGETKPIYIREDRSVMDTIRAGGLVAVVIALLGVVGLLLAAVRFGLVIEAGRFNEGTLNTVVSAVRNRQETTGKSLAGSTGRVIRALLGEKTRDREALMDAAGAALLKETPKIQRFGTAIMVIAAIAPLLGLLGTVTGMISTFEIITEHGTGDPKLLSGGISEALITTQLGLVVAIPMVLLGNLLNGQGSNALRNCERAAFAIINAMIEEQPDDGHSGEKLTASSEAA